MQSYATLAWNMGYTATADAALSRFTTVSPNRFEVLVALADFNRIRGRLIDSADFADQATATAPPDPYKALVELVLVARAVIPEAPFRVGERLGGRERATGRGSVARTRPVLHTRAACSSGGLVEVRPR